MKKSFYRTDFLYPKGSILTGLGSLMSLFVPYYVYNDVHSDELADRNAIESDFGAIGQDMYSVMK